MTMEKAIVWVAALGLAACQAQGAGTPPSEEVDVGQVAQGAAASYVQSVKVVNAPGDWAAPVPTRAEGTTQIAGTVSATQSGAWNVGISGTPTVGAQQSGAWTVDISGTPTVALAEGSSVEVSGTASVNVTNNPAVTLLGTPSVNIAGTPTVSVGSMPAVNIGNSPDVKIANDQANPALVRNTDERGRNPFQKTIHRFHEHGNGHYFDDVSVPSGKRAVIEHVSAYVTLPPGQLVWIQIDSSNQTRHYVPLTKMGSTPGGFEDLYMASLPTTIYADGSLRVLSLRGQDSSGLSSGAASFDITMSGYLIDL